MTINVTNITYKERLLLADWLLKGWLTKKDYDTSLAIIDF